MAISYKETFSAYIDQLQDQICTAIENQDGKASFHEDNWIRPEGGGGRTRIISEGAVFEKGGVNVSKVYGALPQSMMEYLNVSHSNFFACGLSLVIHPFSPMVPTVHANYRYFEVYDGNNNIIKNWFGGGADLTPYYLFEEDAIHFHNTQKSACDQIDTSYYPLFKEQCDNYFHNHHRGEARGIGGIFYDRLMGDSVESSNQYFNFAKSAGDAFIPSYIPIVDKRKDIPYTDDQKEWQEIRRGRYVEFNLIHDKGTLFGLRTNGRIESILMSLPKTVRWEYMHVPKADSEEQRLLDVLKQPKSWATV